MKKLIKLLKVALFLAICILLIRNTIKIGKIDTQITKSSNVSADLVSGVASLQTNNNYLKARIILQDAQITILLSDLLEIEKILNKPFLAN